MTFSGAKMQWDTPSWGAAASYQTNEWDASDDWRLDEVEGETRIHLEQTRWVVDGHYRDWHLAYQYRTVNGDMVTNLYVLDELIAGIGKGSYLIVGQADFDQHAVSLTPPAWRSRWGTIATVLDVSYLDNIQVKADIYEPLLFLGLPVLADTQDVSIKAIGVAVAHLSWTKSYQHWQLQTHLSQVIPWHIEQSGADVKATVVTAAVMVAMVEQIVVVATPKRMKKGYSGRGLRSASGLVGVIEGCLYFALRRLKLRSHR
jgi:hypothetical protein